MNHCRCCSNGTISSIDVIVDSRVRVLSVEGANLKRWDVAQGSADSKDPKVVCAAHSVLCI